MNEVKVLKKLAGRRKMFEDYIILVKKPEGVKGRLRRERWGVKCEKLKVRESKMAGKWDVRHETQGMGNGE